MADHGLEPSTDDHLPDHADSDAKSLRSIAISLKRIADVLEGNEKSVGIIGALFESRNP